MGSDPSKTQKSNSKTINRLKWRDVSNTEQYTIVKDLDSQQEGQEYQFWLDHRYDIKKELKVYQQRNSLNGPIIKTLDYAYQVREKGFADIIQFNVITERIPSKLSKLPQLTYPECLYILDQSLKGYESLYKKVGPFQINQQMIGFNTEGNTRVWLNSNYAKNQALRKKPILLTTKSTPDICGQSENSRQSSFQDQAFMVKNIASVIESKCQEGRFPNKFRDKIYHQCRSFEEARSALKSEVQNKKLLLPSRIDYLNNRVLVDIKQSQNRHVSNIQPIQKASSVIQNRTVTTNRKLKFNYQQPTQYFHPQMYSTQH